MMPEHRSAEDPLSVQCYNAGVAAMSDSGRWQEALAILNEMRRTGVRPDNYTYSAASEFFAFWTTGANGYSVWMADAHRNPVWVAGANGNPVWTPGDNGKAVWMTGANGNPAWMAGAHVILQVSVLADTTIGASGNPVCIWQALTITRFEQQELTVAQFG